MRVCAMTSNDTRKLILLCSRIFTQHRCCPADTAAGLLSQVPPSKNALRLQDGDEVNAAITEVLMTRNKWLRTPAGCQNFGCPVPAECVNTSSASLPMQSCIRCVCMRSRLSTVNFSCI